MTDQTQRSRTETGGFNWERAAACPVYKNAVLWK